MQIHTLSRHTVRHARRLAQTRVERLAAVAHPEGGPTPVAEMLGVSFVLVIFMALAIIL